MFVSRLTIRIHPSRSSVDLAAVFTVMPLGFFVREDRGSADGHLPSQAKYCVEARSVAISEMESVFNLDQAIPLSLRPPPSFHGRELALVRIQTREQQIVAGLR